MLPSQDCEITQLLLAWRAGDQDALSQLMPVTYRSLKAVAASLLRRESPKNSLETTALVHEAYVRLVNLDRVDWQDRAHFYAMSARMMRQILVDQARARKRLKRGSEPLQISFEDWKLDGSNAPRPSDLLALDDALRDLSAIDQERARVVELRFFGGLGREEIAQVLEVSSATVSRRWRSARAWLLNYLEGSA